MILLSLFSCRKDNNQTSRIFKNIVAGDTQGENIIYKNIIDTSIQATVHYYPSHLEYLTFDLGLINSNSKDLKFYINNTGSSGGYNTTIGILANANYYIAIDSLLIDNNIFSPKIFIKGDTINENLHYKNSSDFVFLNANSSFNEVRGKWLNKTDSYIGIKVITNNKDTVFGWIKLDVLYKGSIAKITVKDFAYRK